MKVKGVYTGGHQENLRLASVNINFGPGGSEWIIMDKSLLTRLRDQVLLETKNRVDIVVEETLWYIEPDKLIKWGIPFDRFV
jgi:JmjC domain, hydroxylase